MRSRVLLVAALVQAGCLIEQVPRYDDDLSVSGGKAPSLRAIAVGKSLACGVHESGQVSCWGANRDDQLGTGQQMPAYRPVRMAHFDDVEQLALGLGHSCALRSGGELWCWGYNQAGSLGNGEEAPDSEPVGPVQALLPRSAARIWADGHGSMALLDDGTVGPGGRVARPEQG